MVSGRLFREHCSLIVEGMYTKDLSVITNRTKDNLILVDNALYSFVLNMENGVPITPFYSNKKDNELLKLRDFLMPLVMVEDVRPIIKEHFKWDTFIKHGT